MSRWGPATCRFVLRRRYEKQIGHLVEFTVLLYFIDCDSFYRIVASVEKKLKLVVQFLELRIDSNVCVSCQSF